MTKTNELSRRERQIMDVLYRRRGASAAEVRESLRDAPSYSAVRALLRILEEKGHVQHEAKDLHYVYFPTVSRERVRGRALRHVVETFFDGSAADAVASLLGPSAAPLSDEELDRISGLIANAKKGDKS